MPDPWVSFPMDVGEPTPKPDPNSSLSPFGWAWAALCLGCGIQVLGDVLADEWPSGKDG